MKKVKIAMYDEKGYTERLADYLSRNHGDLFEVRLFTQTEPLKDFLENGIADLLLIGEEEYVNAKWDSERCTGIGTVVLLVGEERDAVVLPEDVESSMETNISRIYQYQSAQEIIRELIKLVADREHIYDIGVGKDQSTTRIIGVYSPFGGAGVSSYARALACEEGKTDTLLICMEFFDGLGSAGNSQEKTESYRGLSELIFYVHQEDRNIGLKLLSLIDNYDGVDCIRTVSDYRDLLTLSPKDAKNLMRHLRMETGYSRIVIDIGFMGAAIMEVLSSCDELYFPESNTESQKQKWIHFQHILKKENLEDILKKVQYVDMVGFGS